MHAAGSWHLMQAFATVAEVEGRCGLWQVTHVMSLFWKHLLWRKLRTWLATCSSSGYFAS